MQASKVVGLLAVGAVAVVAVVAVEQRPDRDDSHVLVKRIDESKVAWLKNRKVYQTPVLLVDGGLELELSTEAPCKRRPRGAQNCLRTHTDIDGRSVTEEAPELNRYPAAEMSGRGCEGCACSVWLGEDPDAPEEPVKK